MNISGAKFQERCFNIPRYIQTLFSNFTISGENLMMPSLSLFAWYNKWNVTDSKTKKDIPERKNLSY